MTTNDYNDLFDADDDLSPHHLLVILLRKEEIGEQNHVSHVIEFLSTLNAVPVKKERKTNLNNKRGRLPMENHQAKN